MNGDETLATEAAAEHLNSLKSLPDADQQFVKRAALTFDSALIACLEHALANGMDYNRSVELTKRAFAICLDIFLRGATHIKETP